ncbi:hypothetical protein ACRYCC_17960 [Actinomadura scrupuli]|uniref:hypothetical protein n=1 Tax=Actinomadura scrupuli TaxID=559629 RepID=UPI003D9592B4
MAGFHQDERHGAPAPPEFTVSMYGGPEPGARWDEPVPALAAVLTALRRSNHATAFASWTVTTIGLGLVFQARTAWSAGSASIVLLAALLPVLALAARVTVLLVLAGRAGAQAVVGGAWRDEPGPSTGAAAGEPPVPGAAAPSGPASAEELESMEALDRLIMLTAAVRRREALAHAALNWAYAAGVAFLAWSLLTALLTGG